MENTVQGLDSNEWLITSLKPWAITLGNQHISSNCIISSVSEFGNLPSILCVPYYSISDLILLSYFLTAKIETKIYILLPTVLINTPLGSFISQRGLETYVGDELKKVLRELLHGRTAHLLWFPQSSYMSKDSRLMHLLGISDVGRIITQIYNELCRFKNFICEESKEGTNNFAFPPVEFSMLNMFAYPSFFDSDPLETICELSYEELAHGTISSIEVSETILDKGHWVYIYLEKLFENVFSEDLSLEIFTSKCLESLCNLSTNRVPPLEFIVFNLLKGLFPGEYTRRSFRNRLQVQLKEYLSYAETSQTECMKKVYEELSTGKSNLALSKLLQFFEKSGLCVTTSKGYAISYSKRIKNVVRIISTTNREAIGRRSTVNSQKINWKAKWIPNFLLGREIANRVYKEDVELFEKDYSRHFSVEWSKDPAVGRPFFLRSYGSTVGIVLSHGYLSAPMEVYALGHYLHKCGYNVYGVRLKGHGTSPLDLAQTSWEEWYTSYLRGVACLMAICDHVFLCGFSAGGCLALLSSVERQDQVAGVISISAPQRLQNYAIHLVPTIYTLNAVLKRFGGTGWELLDHHPENPHINYPKNPISGLQQLRLLMENTETNLSKIRIPILVIQGSDDATVNPESANIIFRSVSSIQKQLVFFNRLRHGIINGPGSEEIFFTIKMFIESILRNKMTSK